MPRYGSEIKWCVRCYEQGIRQPAVIGDLCRECYSAVRAQNELQNSTNSTELNNMIRENTENQNVTTDQTYQTNYDASLGLTRNNPSLVANSLSTFGDILCYISVIIGILCIMVCCTSTGNTDDNSGLNVTLLITGFSFIIGGCFQRILLHGFATIIRLLTKIAFASRTEQ